MKIGGTSVATATRLEFGVLLLQTYNNKLKTSATPLTNPVLNRALPFYTLQRNINIPSRTLFLNFALNDQIERSRKTGG
jgi:hypothetical protein